MDRDMRRDTCSDVVDMFFSTYDLTGGISWWQSKFHLFKKQAMVSEELYIE
jgi:hypothetical protein